MSNLCHYIESTFPPVFIVGEGNVQVLRGFCHHPEKKIRRLSVLVGNRAFSIQHTSMPCEAAVASFCRCRSEAYSTITSGFLGFIPIDKDFCETTHLIKLRAELVAGGYEEIPLGHTRFISRAESQAIDNLAMRQQEGPPLVAICLAAYNPDPSAFERQIHSIIHQTYKNWICIINDDSSLSRNFRKLKESCSGDPRFLFGRNESNQGFYKNFELCLRKVPEDASFVALSDQDDYWYPDKLEKCLSAFEKDTVLVYSDMRIVGKDGEVIAPTYWFNRKNYYRDLDLMLLANTVTGAASMFRANLLPKLLPFPTRIGDMFHDHWLACCALMAGRINYIDEPLYDYYQHGSNAIGQCDFAVIRYQDRLKRWCYDLGRLVKPSQGRTLLAQLRRNLLAVYDYEYLRIHLITEILRVRFLGMTRVQCQALDTFDNTWRTVFSMMKLHLKVWRRRETTNDAEFRLCGSYLMNLINKFYLVLFKIRIGRRICETVQRRIAEQQCTLSGHAIESKIAPLHLTVDSGETRRVNILIPEINFRHFFGGYIGKFNFAKRLHDQGYQVRLIVVDWCDCKPKEWKSVIEQYEGLENFFDYVEVAYCFDRSVEIRMHPDDVIIATTWWTAHIAHAARLSLNQGKFIYFIQEYEPFTFPMGSYFAMAHQSYSFPHRALFSTEFLLEYFKMQRVGVFSDSFPSSPPDALFFQNAILDFDVQLEDMQLRKIKKLLFYARPEAHASRNMFEVGLLALGLAIEKGYFDDKQWEFCGIGTTLGDITLPMGKSLKMLGKLGLKEYRDLLPEYDLGLSLMYTPHPSLVPLEMAAAGQIVVTNSCQNKTRRKMADLSTNIIAGEATVEGIVESLKEAVAIIGDYPRRLAGTQMKWPTSWKETFSDTLMADLGRWIG